MAVLTVTTITRAGVDAPVAAAAGGDVFTNTGREFVEVANAAGASITVTVATTIDGTSVTPISVTVPATTGRRKIGPFPPGTYNNSAGQVALTYSAVTSVTVGVYTIG